MSGKHRSVKIEEKIHTFECLWNIFSIIYVPSSRAGPNTSFQALNIAVTFPNEYPYIRSRKT
jgi:hypothetical protein